MTLEELKKRILKKIMEHRRGPGVKSSAQILDDVFETITFSGYVLVREEDVNWQTDKPSIDNFISSLQIEINHQGKRWGKEHDNHKTFEHWMSVGLYLMGKAVKASWDGDSDKVLHHIITTSAAMGNCHAMIRAREAHHEHP